MVLSGKRRSAGGPVVRACLLGAVIVALAAGRGGVAQDDSGGTDAGSCALRDHVYSCSGAAFERVLANAKTVAVDVHNYDGVSRRLLGDLLTRKLGKTLASGKEHPDLIFMLIPIEPGGIAYSTGDVALGTLRVYSVTADGGRGHLLWAETYSGASDLPWPAVARRLVVQFEGHFSIK
ncbi:MAG TPA: hypothetical protein VGU46_04725 [Acidobacteriaceae bacterium]|nr:hypothetical protein [Acidobacteriaceae bacterium]